MGKNQYYHNAFELVSEIKARNKFCIGAACYPETHPESKNRVEDIARLKEKLIAVLILSQLKCFLIMRSFITSVRCVQLRK